MCPPSIPRSRAQEDSHSPGPAKSSDAGGIAGYSGSSVENTYAIVRGAVSSATVRENRANGLVGSQEASASLNASYYNASRDPGDPGGPNAGFSDSSQEAQARAIDVLQSATPTSGTVYAGWSLGIWDFGTGTALPTLRTVPPCPAGGTRCRFD